MTGEGWRGGENDWCLHSVLPGFLLVEEDKIEVEEPWVGFPCSRPRGDHGSHSPHPVCAEVSSNGFESVDGHLYTNFACQLLKASIMIMN